MKFFKKLLNLHILPKLLPTSQRYTAFTLAEVLITLGVIGIVAAMTIPTLINEYQKHVIVEKAKRTYNIFSQLSVIIRKEQGDFT